MPLPTAKEVAFSKRSAHPVDVVLKGFLCKDSQGVGGRGAPRPQTASAAIENTHGLPMYSMPGDRSMQ